MNITTKKMKQALIIFSTFLLLSCCKSQTTGYAGREVYDTLGDIFNVSFNASSGSLFSRTGSSGTWVYNSSSLDISGTGTNLPDNFIQYLGWFTDLEKNTCEMIFTPNSDGYGIGIGYAGSNNRQYYGRIVLTGATKGQLVFDAVNGSVTNRVNSGTTYFNVTNGQEHKLTLRRTPDTIFLKITNDVTEDSLVLPYPQNFTTSYFDSYKTGKMSIFWLGGSQSISNFRYYSPIQKNPRLLFTGDSNMQGAFAGSNNARYTQLIDSNVVARCEVDAGAGNTSADIVNLLPEILLIKPRALFVNIGTNGITQANIDTIVNTCLRNNIIVFLSTIFPTASGVNSNNSIIRGKSGVTLIDFDSTLLNGGSTLYSGYNSGDGVHLNASGNMAVYTQLMANLSSYLSSP